MRINRTDNRKQNYKELHIWGRSDKDHKAAMIAIFNKIKAKLTTYSRNRTLLKVTKQTLKTYKNKASRYKDYDD